MRIRRRHLPGILAAAAISLAAAATLATAQEIYQARRADYAASVLAAGGYDAVAYHTQRQAIPGNANFRVSWKNAEWHFASEANRDAFVRDPDRFAPQYGGWCAFAAAAGVKSSSDPRFFDIVNGRLYLNQSSGTQSSWRRDQAGMIQRGDQNWTRLATR